MAIKTIYHFTALTGGAATALDSVDGNSLLDLDRAFVITSSTFYIYELDADSGLAESSPNVISPDTNAGTKRWILISIMASETMVNLSVTSLTTGYFPYHVSDAAGFADSIIFQSSSKVAIGGTTVDYKLNLFSDCSALYTVGIRDTRAYAINVGGQIDIIGKYNAAGAETPFAGLMGGKENATDDNKAGYFVVRTTNAAGSQGERVRIDSTGQVGIGKTPTYQLELSTDSAGKPGAGGLWTVVSDERIKSDIKPADLNRCYEIIKSIPLKYFCWADNSYTKDQVKDRHNLGWIAQDVQKVFPKAVNIKPFVKSEKIIDDNEEYEEQDFYIINKDITTIEIKDGQPVQIIKQQEEKVLLFDILPVINENKEQVFIIDEGKRKPFTYQVPRMIKKIRPKFHQEIIEDCLDLNSGQIIAALYGAVQAIMLKIEKLEIDLKEKQK